MYKILLNEGILIRDKIDKEIYPGFVSQRTFYRDMNLIKKLQFENIKHSKDSNGYVLINRKGK